MKKFERQLIKGLGIYIVPLVVVIAVIGISLLYVIPAVKMSIARLEIINLKKLELTKLIKKRTLLESFKRDSTTYLNLAESALPQEKNADTILVSLDNVTQNSQMGADGVSFSPGLVSSESADLKSSSTALAADEKHNGAFVLPVNYSVRGTSDQFVAFVNQLLGSRRIFDIESMSISYAQEIPDFVLVDFRLLVYYLPPITEIGSIESELPEITGENTQFLADLNQMPYLSVYTIQPSQETSILFGKNNPFGP